MARCARDPHFLTYWLWPSLVLRTPCAARVRRNDAIAKKITWWQAAEIIGICDRQMRRWRERHEAFGYDGLFDRRRGRPSPKQVPLRVVERVLGLYGERYHDLNVRHFHEKFQAAASGSLPNIRAAVSIARSMTGIWLWYSLK
jgi:hypothetical protein